jgi:very-short-patch-repair endonuclease
MIKRVMNTVLRFWNDEVFNNMDGVLERIASYL